MNTKFAVLFTSLLISQAYAQTMSCKPYDFLKGGFDLQAYEQCQKTLKECPTAGGAANFNCAKDKASKTASCKQLQELSKVLEANPASISAEAADKYTVINHFFIADGQNHYYIVSPQACLVDTIIDPRKLSPQLKKQYENVDFMTVNLDNPSIVKVENGKTTFNAILKITKSCLACEILGYATINFIFDTDGKLIKADLENFAPEQTSSSQ